VGAHDLEVTLVEIVAARAHVGRQGADVSARGVPRRVEHAAVDGVEVAVAAGRDGHRDAGLIRPARLARALAASVAVRVGRTRDTVRLDDGVRAHVVIGTGVDGAGAVVVTLPDVVTAVRDGRMCAAGLRIAEILEAYVVLTAVEIGARGADT